MDISQRQTKTGFLEEKNCRQIARLIGDSTHIAGIWWINWWNISLAASGQKRPRKWSIFGLP